MKGSYKWLILTCLLTAGLSSSVSAQINIGNVQITEETGSNASCPSGITWCGLGFKPSGGSSFYGSSGNGFHDYVPTQASLPDGPGSQTWLNTQSNAHNSGVPQFTLCGGGVCSGSLVNTSSANNWRQPGNSTQTDLGWYLTTISTSNPIKIQFGTVGGNSTSGYTCSHCISEFSLYWGSVDTWNTITFTDVAGNKVSFTGSQVVRANSTIPTLGQNNIASFVYDFQLQYSGVGTAPYLWQSVSFSSSAAAFEFDNINWVTATGIIAAPLAAPTPEPSSLAMFVIGLCGIVTSVRRRK
jgi:hypothetical protein